MRTKMYATVFTVRYSDKLKNSWSPDRVCQKKKKNSVAKHRILSIDSIIWYQKQNEIAENIAHNIIVRYTYQYQ